MATTAATRQRYAFVMFQTLLLGAWRMPCKTSSTIGFRANASRFRLSHGRKTPKLLHQAQGIEVGPLFDDLATHDVKDIGAGKRHVLPSWGKTLKGPLMDATPSVANRHLVPLSNHVLSRELEVGEGGGVSGHQLFGLLDASNGWAARK